MIRITFLVLCLLSLTFGKVVNIVEYGAAVVGDAKNWHGTYPICNSSYEGWAAIINQAIGELANDEDVDTIFFPKGTFFINEQILLYGKTTLLGSGAETKLLAYNLMRTTIHKSMIHTKVMAHDSGTAYMMHDITISNMAIEGNNISGITPDDPRNVAYEGLIQFRGARNCKLENLNIIVSGENHWAIRLEGYKKNFEISNCEIENVGNFTTGGCLWVRGAKNGGYLGGYYHGKDVTNLIVDNCVFKNNSKDEHVIINDDMIDNNNPHIFRFKDCEIKNCEFIGEEKNGISPSYGLIIRAKYLGTNLGIHASNLKFNGKYHQAALLLGAASEEDAFNDWSIMKPCYSNMKVDNIEIDAYIGGVSVNGIYAMSKEICVTNANIKNTNPQGKAACNVSLKYSQIYSPLYSCNVSHSYIDVSYIALEKCKIIEDNLIITSSGQGIRGDGGDDGIIIRNNEIRSRGHGIYLIGNSGNMIENALIEGNYIRRDLVTDNYGTIGILVHYADGLVYKNNRTRLRQDACWSTGFNGHYSFTGTNFSENTGNSSASWGCY